MSRRCVNIAWNRGRRSERTLDRERDIEWRAIPELLRRYRSGEGSTHLWCWIITLSAREQRRFADVPLPVLKCLARELRLGYEARRGTALRRALRAFEALPADQRAEFVRLAHIEAVPSGAAALRRRILDEFDKALAERDDAPSPEH